MARRLMGVGTLGILAILVLLSGFLLSGCPQPTDYDPGDGSPGDGAPDDGPNSEPLPAGDVPSFFWGRWVRMDGVNEQWYISDRGVAVGDEARETAIVDTSTLAVEGQTVRPRTDNMITVTPADGLEYYLFRQSGAGASMVAGVRGSGTSARGVLSGLSGISAIIRNINNTSNTITTSTGADGSAEFDTVIPGDEYELEVPVQEGIDEPVTVTVRPEFDGENVGFVTLNNAAQNFKVGYSVYGGNYDHIYAGETYSLTVQVTNHGTEDMLSADYRISPPDGLTLSGSGIEDILGTVAKDGGMRGLSFTMRVDPFTEILKDFVIPIRIVGLDGEDVWEDAISIRVFRRPMTVEIRCDQNDVQGVLISPDAESIAFSTWRRGASISVPVREQPYILALSGANYNSETKYAFRIDGEPLNNGSALTTATVFEPNNDESQATPAYLAADYLGYLGVYDLDFFQLHYTLQAGQAVGWTNVQPAGTAVVTNTTPEFSWDPVAGSSAYELQIAETLDDVAAAEVIRVDTNVYTPETALTNDTSHYWRVRAIDAFDTATQWSSAFTFQISWGAMTGLSPAAETTTNSNLPVFEWSPVSGASSYEFQIVPDGSSWDGASTELLTDGAVAHIPDSPLASGAYLWRVRGVDAAGGTTPWGEETALTIRWGSPANLVPNGDVLEETRPQLSWDVGSDLSGASGVELQIATSVEALEAATIRQVTETPFSSYTPPESLENNTTHHWRVRGVDEAEQPGTWSDVASFSVSWGEMSGLSPASGETVDTTRPTFSWNAVAGADHYELQLAPDGSDIDAGTTQECINLSACQPATALSNYTTYQWRVRAVDAGGAATAWSSVYSITVSWGLISGLSPADGATVIDSTPELSWDVVNGAIGYEVQVADTEAGVAGATAIGVTTNSYTHATPLSVSEKLYWRVRAQDADGQYGTWSSTVYLEHRYSIGDTGPAGGFVFYDQGSYSDGWRYLEAAPSDIDVSGDYTHVWGGHGTSVGATGTAIGTGQANTAAIVATYGSSEPYAGTGNYAARLCDQYDYGGYDDWFLPSKDELEQLCAHAQTFLVGGFASDLYWSSSENTEHTPYSAWNQSFGGLYLQYDYVKYSLERIRAVRSF